MSRVGMVAAVAGLVLLGGCGPAGGGAAAPGPGASDPLGSIESTVDAVQRDFDSDADG